VIEQVMKAQNKWHMYYNGKHDWFLQITELTNNPINLRKWIF
jgi:hypothetical protein